MPEARAESGGRRPRGQRTRDILVAARQILEEHGHEDLTMRRLGAAVGIRAPSLYKHFPDKAAVEVALIEEGFMEIAAARASTPGPILSRGNGPTVISR